MSHFTVAIRLDKSLGEAGDPDMNEIEAAVDKALLPYKESGCGSDDPPELKQFLTFNDSEPEYREEYEKETATRVKMPDGSFVSPYDDRFKVRKSDEVFARYDHVVPDNLPQIEVPYKELYKTFDEFCTEYHGARKDPQLGKYGYWQNPNKKWDWWKIGGRWAGHWPTKKYGNRDFCRIKDLALIRADAQAEDAANKFWDEWTKFSKDGKDDFPPFEGPRDTALRLGLLDCKDGSELTGKEWKKVKWPKDHTGAERDRYDVFENVTREQFDKDYKVAFDPLKTYACLDPKRGWLSPGEMGWFGCSSDDPQGYLSFARGYRDWLAGGDQDDWIVCVDCHI